MSTTDIIIRLLVALLIIGLYFTKIINGFWAIGLLVVAGTFVLTSLLGTCPLYLIFGITSKKEKRSF